MAIVTGWTPPPPARDRRSRSSSSPSATEPVGTPRTPPLPGPRVGTEKVTATRPMGKTSRSSRKRTSKVTNRSSPSGRKGWAWPPLLPPRRPRTYVWRCWTKRPPRTTGARAPAESTRPPARTCSSSQGATHSPPTRPPTCRAPPAQPAGETGFDLVAANDHRFNELGAFPSKAHKKYCAKRRPALDPRTLPALVADPVLGNKLWRREFWQSLPERCLVPEDTDLELRRAVLAAQSVDVLPGPVLLARQRESVGVPLDKAALTRRITTMRELSLGLGAEDR